MHVIGFLLSGLLSLFMSGAFADHNADPVAKNATKVELQGVYVQTHSEQLLTTTNEAYLLLDSQHVVDDLIEPQPSVLIQSFRVCLSGHLEANAQINKGQYPQVLVVEGVCDSSK